MELRHLRYFDALAEALNFTRAAQRLHVTQSTLSHQIRQLEDELGYPLFDRTTKKVTMTEAGEVLRSHMVPALQQIDRAVQALRDAPPSLQGSIRLGTTHSFNTRLVPAVRLDLPRLGADHPCQRRRAVGAQHRARADVRASSTSASRTGRTTPPGSGSSRSTTRSCASSSRTGIRWPSAAASGWSSCTRPGW